MSKYNLYTIGYAGFELDDFISVLKENSVGALVDVRSSPYSSFHEIYNQENLENNLKKNGIYYLFLGESLGARPKDRSLYTDNVVDFTKVKNSSPFIQGCHRIHDGLRKIAICMMCAEKDPITCHRTILVADAFRNYFPEAHIYHIQQDGKIETQHQIDRRIMVKYHLEQEDFFKSFSQRLRQAYALQEKAIAYRED